MRFLRFVTISVIACLLSPFPTSGITFGGLTGTEFSVHVQFQPDAASDLSHITFVETAIVDDEVEFPSVVSIEILSNPFLLLPVDVSIDVGDQFIGIDFDDAGFGAFATGLFNGYLFQFDSAVAVDILNAFIDPITTIGLTDADLAFEGNLLTLNVAGRLFDPTSFARISLEVSGGPTSIPTTPPTTPIPLPATIWFLLTGLGCLAVFSIARRSPTTLQIR